MTVRAYVRNSPAQSAGAQTSSEASVEAYGLYLLNWITITILALFVGVSLALLKLSMALEGELLGGMATVAGLTAAGHVVLSRVRAVRIAYVLISIAQLGLVSMLGAVLTYVTASANLPLQDALLDSWDKFFGLDWTAYYRLMTAWPALLPYACLSYGAIGLPPIAVPIVLGLTNNHVRLQQFTMATLLTLCAVCFDFCAGTGHRHLSAVQFANRVRDLQGERLSHPARSPARGEKQQPTGSEHLADRRHRDLSQLPCCRGSARAVGVVGRVVDASMGFNDVRCHAGSNALVGWTLLCGHLRWCSRCSSCDCLRESN
nr:hypothetical protein [Bradyrhizobium genosp. SA-3]